MKKAPDYNNHMLVPEHKKLSEADKKKLLEKVSLNKLPIIKSDDPAISSLKLERNDVVKITRTSPTSKETIFYRRVH
jgi:DNA-directed RNA polymerase subunit H